MSNEKKFRQDISTRQEIEEFRDRWSRMDKIISQREKMLNEKKFKKEYLLPKQDDLKQAILDQPTDLDLSMKMPAIELFKEHLLKTSIFKKDQKGKISLRDPRFSDKRAHCRNPDRLLHCLSNELFNFFCSAKKERKGQFVTWDHLVYALRYLAASEPWLVTSGIAREKAFDKAIQQIYNWMEKYYKICIVSTETPTKIIGKRSELIDLFYAFFHESSRLPDEGIFLCIAYIFSYLGLEQGGTQQIAGRIKKAFSRRGKPLRTDRLTYPLPKDEAS